jgi:hypothetical protein
MTLAPSLVCFVVKLLQPQGAQKNTVLFLGIIWGKTTEAQGTLSVI